MDKKVNEELQEIDAVVEGSELVAIAPEESTPDPVDEDGKEPDEETDSPVEESTDETAEETEEYEVQGPAEATTDASATVPKTLADEVDALRGKLGAYVLEKKALSDKVSLLKQQAEEREDVITKMEGDLAKAETAVTTLKASLSNPAAFMDAVEGHDGDIKDAVAGDVAAKSLIEQYKAIADPREKSSFWNANQAGIKAEMKEAARG